MELKQMQMVTQFVSVKLLIVPYGIETITHSRFLALRHSLLIVPYGIETRFKFL